MLEDPEALPPDLLARLRGAVSNSVPPPGEAQIQNPWSSGDTENQRMIAMARSLVGQVVAGTPDSPAARGWGAFAEAFLKAHDRDGWYEAESPGYLALSLTGLLQLADHAPQAAVRDLAKRQLDLLLATWAQSQVGGFPAGPKSRTNSAWALTPRSTPWAAWAWLAAGIGNPDEINFMDRPELPVSRYPIPDGVVRLLTERRKQPSYEILERRRIGGGHGPGALPGLRRPCRQAAPGPRRLLGGGAEAPAGERRPAGGTAGGGRRLRGLEEEGGGGAADAGRGRGDPLHGRRRRPSRLPPWPPGQSCRQGAGARGLSAPVGAVPQQPGSGPLVVLVRRDPHALRASGGAPARSVI